jgi:hypothetical protein
MLTHKSLRTGGLQKAIMVVNHILSEVMRQADQENNNFIDLLHRISGGRCTDKIYERLNTRQPKSLNAHIENGEWKNSL